MNYLVIFICGLTFIVLFICKKFGFSMLYPTLLILLAVIVDILVNTINERKEEREKVNLDELKNKIKSKNTNKDKS